MRVGYLGTSAFAVAVLERLAASHHVVAVVVTRPDRPKGRGRQVLPPPVATAARALDLPLLQPDDVHAIELPPVDVLVVCAFGALIKEPLLSDHEILNVHPSLLPRWRGAAPIERAIMAGDTETGVAIMRLTAGLDSGPVALQATEPIRPDDDSATLSHRLQERGADLLIEAMDTRPAFTEQPEEGVTYAEKITAADRTLGSDPVIAERTVRALRPHIGARIPLAEPPTKSASGDEPEGRGRRYLGVWAARVGGGEPNWHGLELLEVQPAGGRRMAADAWMRGHGGSLTP